MLEARQQIEEIYRTESRQVLATLIRLLGDFDSAEDALHDAFRAAIEQWPQEGIPSNPRAWLISVGRFKTIDRLRRQARFETTVDDRHEIPEAVPAETEEYPSQWNDDRLRLIFTCCHPALAPEARSALTLREVCGLTTEEIASAFLTKPPAIAQRIVRAKAKIRDAKIPYQIPEAQQIAERLETVLQVIYLVFNEGYSASSGGHLTRPDLSGEAIRLGKLLVELLPEPEVLGLTALMLLHESRRAARTSAAGDLILLEDQDRSLWNQELIGEGREFVERALQTRRFGRYTIQAAIAAVHAVAREPAKTDWVQIAALYDALLRIDPSPIVELNRAVAIAMRDGPAAGLTLLDDLIARGQLEDYRLLYSVRADLFRRLGRNEEARGAYQDALKRTQLEPERRFLERRLSELS